MEKVELKMELREGEERWRRWWDMVELEMEQREGEEK